MTIQEMGAVLKIIRPNAQYSFDTAADGIIHTIHWLDTVQIEPTPAEITAALPQVPAALIANLRTSAVNSLISDTSPNSKFIRAVLLTILDEINVIRALLPGPPAPRTVAQLRNAVQAKINAGTAD